MKLRRWLQLQVIIVMAGIRAVILEADREIETHTRIARSTLDLSAHGVFAISTLFLRFIIVEFQVNFGHYIMLFKTPT